MVLGLMFTQEARLFETAMWVAEVEDPASSGETADWLATPVVTLIAAAIAALSAVWAAIKASETARIQRERDATDKSIDFCRQQLNELYGPLYMLRRTSRRLYDVLREQMQVASTDHEKWRLVDHILDVQGGSELAQSSVERILKINIEIQTLLKSKWGLLEVYPPHQSFIDFSSHSELLQQAWDKKANQDADSRTPFPRGIDKDIEADIDSIRAKLEKLVTQKSK